MYSPAVPQPELVHWQRSSLNVVAFSVSVWAGVADAADPGLV